MNYRKYLLYDDKLVVEMKSTRQIDRFEIRLDKIGFEKQYQAENTFVGRTILWVLLFVFLGICGLAYVQNENKYPLIIIYSSLVFIIIALQIFKQPKDDIYLVGGQRNLVFYRKFPSEEETLKFVDQVIAASKKYIKEKYSVFDSNTLEPEYNARLIWLFQREIITREEMEELKDDFKIRQLLH